MTDNYDGSQVLFRIAKARSAAAREFGEQAEREKQAGGNGMERRQRERDAVIETIVMTQGAAEGYINWVFLRAGLPTGSDWIGRWGGLGHAARQLGRSDFAGLPKEHRAFFVELNAWRNFLLHGDKKSRDALTRSLDRQGTTDYGRVPDLWTAAYAAEVVTRAEAAFRWAEAQTGVGAPFMAGAWVAFDESSDDLPEAGPVSYWSSPLARLFRRTTRKGPR